MTRGSGPVQTGFPQEWVQGSCRSVVGLIPGAVLAEGNTGEKSASVESILREGNMLALWSVPRQLQVVGEVGAPIHHIHAAQHAAHAR